MSSCASVIFQKALIVRLTEPAFLCELCKKNKKQVDKDDLKAEVLSVINSIIKEAQILGDSEKLCDNMLADVIDFAGSLSVTCFNCQQNQAWISEIFSQKSHIFLDKNGKSEDESVAKDDRDKNEIKTVVAFDQSRRKLVD